MIKVNIASPSTVRTNLTSSNNSVTINPLDNTVFINAPVKESGSVSLRATKSLLAYGYSAYDLAAANGYKGTIDEWLLSLQGQSPYVNLETNTWWAYSIEKGWYDTHITADDSLKQDLLVSGQNIKTINGLTLLGEGNLEIEGGGGILQDPDDLTGGIVTGHGTSSSSSVSLKNLIIAADDCLIINCGTSTTVMED